MKLNGLNRIRHNEERTDSSVHCLQLPFADIYAPLSVV
jgi:hypothetical protein